MPFKYESQRSLSASSPNTLCNAAAGLPDCIHWYMNRISEQIKPFSCWLTPYRKDLVSSCEHLSMTHWVLCFYGPMISRPTLAATLHNMSAFFPPQMVEKAKNMFKQRAIRHPKHACHLIPLKQHSCWLPGMWTCRNMITLSMHECRAKQTTVERILWALVVMSTSSNYFQILKSCLC